MCDFGKILCRQREDDDKWEHDLFDYNDMQVSSTSHESIFFNLKWHFLFIYFLFSVLWP